ncbi:MAG: DUF1289 domain-containing protein [Oxalobacteraceae bacterium]
MTIDLQTFDPNKHPGPLPSPCVGICQMDHASGFCMGCQRTLEEITDWSVASESKKRAIWHEIIHRRATRRS